MTPTNMALLSLVLLLSAFSADAQFSTPGPLETPPPDGASVFQRSIWANAYFRGTPNNFMFTPMVYSNGLWRTNQTFGSISSPRFKITRNLDWTEAYPAQDFYITQGPGEYAITFNEVTKEITATKIDGTVMIQFQCDRGLTSLGQSVYATGSSPELGNWDRAKAVLLSSNTYPSWRKTIPIRIGQTIQWKCLKRSEADPNMSVEYEPGMNNMFTSNVPTTVFGSF